MIMYFQSYELPVLLIILMICRMFSVGEGIDKKLKPVLYIVYEYMETDLNKYIRSPQFRSSTNKRLIIKVKWL